MTASADDASLFALFDRFGEDARRALFFARWSVTQAGGDSIDESHLLLGILAARPQAVTQFTVPVAWPVPVLEGRLRELSPGGPSPGSSAEIPFSPSAVEAILGAARRARKTGAEVVPEHLLWALLQAPATPVAQLLAEAGVTVQAVEAHLDAGRR